MCGGGAPVSDEEEMMGSMNYVRWYPDTREAADLYSVVDSDCGAGDPGQMR